MNSSSVGLLALLTACVGKDDLLLRDGIYLLLDEEGYSNGLIDEAILAEDYDCAPAHDPAPLDEVYSLAVSNSHTGGFTIHRLADGDVWTSETEGVDCARNRYDEFACSDDEGENDWSPHGSYYVYGWVLSPEELFGIWLDWTVEVEENGDCAAQSTWVAEWSAELPD
jgi:hypothetical protein